MDRLKKLNCLILVTCYIIMVLVSGSMMDISGVQASEIPPLYPGYPDEYDIKGVVDAVSSDHFIIDDSTYGFATAATFHTPSGKVDYSTIKTGDKVGVILEGERLIVSLWLIERKKKKEDTSSAKKKKTTIRKEGGVWKN